MQQFYNWSVVTKGANTMARHHESKKHHKRHGMGHYEGAEARRAQEHEDASMIREDHNAVANLPQNVIMRPYRDGSYGIPEELDDTMRGIDNQIGKDDSQMMKAFKPHKY